MLKDSNNKEESSHDRTDPTVCIPHEVTSFHKISIIVYENQNPIILENQILKKGKKTVFIEKLETED